MIIYHDIRASKSTTRIAATSLTVPVCQIHFYSWLHVGQYVPLSFTIAVPSQFGQSTSAPSGSGLIIELILSPPKLGNDFTCVPYCP